MAIKESNENVGCKHALFGTEIRGRKQREVCVLTMDYNSGSGSLSTNMLPFGYEIILAELLNPVLNPI